MSALSAVMRRPSLGGGSSVAVLRLTRAATRAQRAWTATERGSASAAACAAMALEALKGGVLLDTATRYASYHLCVRVLILTDAFEAAALAIAALDERAGACAAAYRAELALRTGGIADAERWAFEALELVREPQPGPFAADAVSALVCARSERGMFREAHELLRATRGPHGTRLRHARARLMLAEGRYEQAYADACEVGSRRERQGRPNPTWDGWRSTASVALVHLGRRAEATSLAEIELAAARAFGAPVPIARALAARAVAESA